MNKEFSYPVSPCPECKRDIMVIDNKVSAHDPGRTNFFCEGSYKKVLKSTIKIYTHKPKTI